MKLAPILLAAALLAGCSGAAADAPLPAPSSPPETPVHAPSEGGTEPDEAAPIEASWEVGAPAVELPDGLVVIHCEGDAPLLCIRRDGQELGLLALTDHPLTPEFEARVAASDLETALREWAADHLAWVASDRASGCGDGYEFAAEPTVPARLGTFPGIQVGFTGSEGGVVTEHVRLWATAADGRMWIATAEAASPDGCMASDELLVFDPEVLPELLPTLGRVAAGTPLP